MLLEKLVEYQIPFYAMAATVALGLLGKLVAQVTLKRMIKEAENIHNSNHKLMKLIKAKYEHANMISDRVKNVDAFVDKYLYEYRVLGIRFYSWQALEQKCMWGTIAFGILGAAANYLDAGMTETVFRYLAWTGILGMVLFLLHVMTSEKRRLRATRNYIVDYLENVCAHRYVKMQQKEVTKEAEEVAEEPVTEAVLKEEVVKSVEDSEKTKREAAVKEAEEKRISQEIQIRKILEEFLA